MTLTAASFVKLCGSLLSLGLYMHGGKTLLTITLKFVMCTLACAVPWYAGVGSWYVFLVELAGILYLLTCESGALCAT
jgi:hypothetical protein